MCNLHRLRAPFGVPFAFKLANQKMRQACTDSVLRRRIRGADRLHLKQPLEVPREVSGLVAHLGKGRVNPFTRDRSSDVMNTKSPPFGGLFSPV